MLNFEFLLYIAFFLSYFIIHSILASLSFKAWFYNKYPNTIPYYRVLYNIISIILFIPLLVLTFIYPGDVLWQWSGWQAWLANFIAIVAIICFYVSLSDYDMTEFFGFYPFKNGSFTKNQPFTQTQSKTRLIAKDNLHLGRFHLYVRHPWYFFLLLLIWSRGMTSYQLLVAILLTLYLIIGSYLEEKKMIVSFGESYIDYKTRVAGLIPLPWKYMTRTEADISLKKLTNAKN